MKNLINKIKEKASILKAPQNILALFIPIITIYGLFSLEKKTLKLLDLITPFWIISIGMVILIALIFSLRKSILSFIKENHLDKTYLIIISIIAIIATAFCFDNIDANHRILSDEAYYLSMSQNMYSNQLAGYCNEGFYDDIGNLDCIKTNNVFKSKLLSWTHMILIPILGKNLGWAFTFQTLVYFLSFFTIAFAVFLWTKSPTISLLTSVFILLQPTTMFQARSISIEIYFLFWASMSLIIMKWAWQNQTTKAWALFALILGIFIQTHQSSIFCIFCFGIFSLPYMLSTKNSHKFNLFAFCSALTFFTLPLLITIIYYHGSNFQYNSNAEYTGLWGNILTNWKLTNLPLQNSLLQNPFLSYFNITAILGIIASIIIAVKKINMRYILAFIILWQIQVYYTFKGYASGFDIEINQRYAIILFVFMGFFSAILVDSIIKLLTKIFSKKISPERSALLTIILSIIALTAIISHTFSYKESFNKNIMYDNMLMVKEENTIRAWINTLNDDKKLFIYTNSSHLLAYGHSAIYYNDFLKSSDTIKRHLMNKFKNNVYYIRGFLCQEELNSTNQKLKFDYYSNLCSEIESSLVLEEAYTKNIKNLYDLKIYKITDLNKTNMQINSVDLSKISDTTTQVKFDYKLISNIEGCDSIKIYFNDKLAIDRAFKPGKYIDSITNPNIHIGHNKISYIIQNHTNLWEVEKNFQYFIDMDKALDFTNLKILSYSQTWEKPKINSSVLGKPLKSAGINFASGIGTHSFSNLTYEMPKGYNNFISIVGLDDANKGGDGVIFKIIGDGKQLAKSKVINHGILDTLNINISNVKKLELVVDSLKSKDFDLANWINPYILK